MLRHAVRPTAVRRETGAVDLRDVVEQSLKDSWGRLYGYALSLCGDRDAARDLLQGCAMKALDHSAQPREARAARAWLFGIMRNAWIDGLRRDAVRRQDPPAEPIGPTPWSYEDARIAEITVRQGLERIDPAHREIVELVDLAGFRYAEAAQILGVPVGTVMSRLSRARLALLEAIEHGNVTSLERSRTSR